MIPARSHYIDAIFLYCQRHGWDEIWLASNIFFLITGVVANSVLLWLLLRERKSLSASQILGVNLVAMDLLYLSLMPAEVISTIHNEQDNTTDLDFAVIIEHPSNTTDPMEEARDIFSMFNLIGCPLLLACMCVERYLAVIKPTLYLKVRKLEYRIVVCAVVWVTTVSFSMATALTQNRNLIMMLVSIVISCLFVVMLVCLWRMVSSLRQQSPAHTTYGNQARSESPLKRRAVSNVLAVVVPAVVAYLPVLLMVPLVLYIYFFDFNLDQTMCNVFELSVLFPNLGVFIGPLFYLSKARQICCHSGKGKKSIDND